MKKKAAPLFLTLTLLLAACKTGEFPESLPGFEISEISSEETTFSPNTATAAPEAEETSEDVCETLGTSAFESDTSDSSVEIPTSVSSVEIPTDFFDDITPLKYSVLDREQLPAGDKEAENAAIQAYKSSAEYKEALDTAKELCGYENGELVFLTESWKTYYGGFGSYIDETAAPEIDLKAKVVGSIKAKLDGVNEENIFFLAAALPDSWFISSGEPADVVFPVYVNSEGGAFILNSAGYQGGISVSFVQYEKTGKIHLISNGEHSEATMRTAVFSFENGQPKEEIYTYGAIEALEENGRALQWHTSWYWCKFIFYSEELSRYCGIGMAPVTENMAKTILSDNTVLEKVPNIAELYENGELWLLGGKYIIAGWGGKSFEYDGIGFVSTFDGEHVYYIPVLPDDERCYFDEDEYGDYIFNAAIDEILTKQK